MSFVAFSANYPGNPPSPFSPFAKGEVVFYLVGITTEAGSLPAPGAQLSVTSKTEKGRGRNPVDVVMETAQAWHGRSRRTVATRSYRWERYTKGAKAEARDAAQWVGSDGYTLALWSHLVSVNDAERFGYRTPRSRTAARPGHRAVGTENNAGATVRGSRLAALTAQEERESAIRAREYAARTRAGQTPVVAPVAPVAPVESTPVPAATSAPVALSARFQGLDFSSTVAESTQSDRADSGFARFQGLDLD